MSGASQRPAGSGERGHCYYCVRCHTELSFARVEAMSTTIVYFTCPCSHGIIRTEYQRDEAALRRLFGNLRPVLPYLAAPRKAASTHGLSLPGELEVEYASFARTWSGIAYAHEFFMLCDAARQAMGEPPEEGDDGRA